MSTTWTIGLVLLLAVMVPFVPKLLRLRIRFLRWLHWNSLANHMEGHFRGWVLFIRTMMLSAAVVLLFLAKW